MAEPMSNNSLLSHYYNRNNGAFKGKSSFKYLGKYPSGNFSFS